MSRIGILWMGVEIVSREHSVVLLIVEYLAIYVPTSCDAKPSLG
jgi:hypothetical protein